MVKFYFVRHGETDWNVQGRFQGIEDIPLNDTGKEQARRCGMGLKKSGIPFDYVISSPLQRAFDTAETIADYLELETVQREPLRIERDFGKVSGKKREDRDRMLQSGEALDMEEEEAVAERMQQVLTALTEKTYEHILLVSHGASIRALLSRYAEPGSAPATAVQRNVCLSVVVFDGKNWYLEAYDQTPEELR